MGTLRAHYIFLLRKAKMTDTPQQTPDPLERSHASRARVETAVALLGAVFGGVAMLSGLHPITQGIIGGAVAVVMLYAGIAWLRTYFAKRRR